MKKKQKLELTWIGKDERPRLEPRILLEDPELSSHAPHRVSENDVFDNILIQGDNLLALKALEQEYSGKVKCIYIDPPFNTQQAFEHYDDGLEHSLWLTLIRDRLNILHKLLSDDGTLFIHIDDNELAYLMVVADEIFDRRNRAYVVTFKQGSATGHKAINPGMVNVTNYMVVYCKDKMIWQPNRLYTPRERDKRYGSYIENYEEPYTHWKLIPLSQAFANSRGATARELKRQLCERYENEINKYVLENSNRIVQPVRPDYNNVGADVRAAIDSSKENSNEVILLERDGYSDMYFKNGQRWIFYENKLKVIDGVKVAGEPLTTLWDDVLSNNLHNEGGVKFPKGKKPEALIKRAIELSTSEGDIVLDSFAGSGTTGAVAHKMNRRWIMVELGEHCHTHIIPRLTRLINGKDTGGVTQAVDWKGGGGFRYYRIAPSLLEKDPWDNWIINEKYNSEMLAEAICKHEGFTYAPSETAYWQHGHSTERDYIYVTTQTLSRAQLEALSEEVGDECTLLVCCGAFRVKRDAFANLTLKKIPNAVLNRCEFGRDDYSLEISDLPPLPDPLPEGEGSEEQATVLNRKTRKKAASKQDANLSLFDEQETS